MCIIVICWTFLKWRRWNPPTSNNGLIGALVHLPWKGQLLKKTQSFVGSNRKWVTFSLGFMIPFVLHTVIIVVIVFQDAHEFLTAVFRQIQDLAPTLQVFASSMGMNYLCPVQDQLSFAMDWTRTCKRYDLSPRSAPPWVMTVLIKCFFFLQM